MKNLFTPVLVVLLVTACGASRPVDSLFPDTGFQDLGEGNTEFAFELFGRLCRDAGEDNVMFSPFCISSALGMAWAGARGETEAGMAHALGFGDSQSAVHNGFSRLFGLIEREGIDPGEDPITLNIANALWVDGNYPLLDDYVTLVSEYYRAEARNMDFAGDPDAQRVVINDWVEDMTMQRITDLLGPGSVTTATRVVLTSAVYFQGNWRLQFNPELTRDGTFTTLAGEEVTVPFMSRTMDVPFYRGNGFRAVAMQYSDLQSRMIILFPDGDFEGFQNDLDPEMLEEVVGGLSVREVAVVMPPFEFTTDYSLAPALSDMGMGDAFDGSRADFSGFTGERDLFITAVVHKAFVKVDETGTEAAAATGVIMATTAMPSDPPELFLLDRPFVFLIIDDCSGAVLFMGRVTDPSL
ncbi:MAG: serpin family protein [Candidatus Fermentibacteraceae bacterium]